MYIHINKHIRIHAQKIHTKTAENIRIHMHKILKYLFSENCGFSFKYLLYCSAISLSHSILIAMRIVLYGESKNERK